MFGRLISLIRRLPSRMRAGAASGGRPSVRQPSEVYMGLRSQVFNTRPSDVGITPDRTVSQVWAALMEWRLPDATATLLCLADGTTSLYLSHGGGVIGAGNHPAVAEAARDFLVTAAAARTRMQPASEFPLPSAGHVSFHVLTLTTAYTAERPEKALLGGGDDLSPLFNAGSRVLMEIDRLNADRR